MNGIGEYVDIYLDLNAKKLVMDRVHSGIVDFERIAFRMKGSAR